jgi:hypothetical protein
VTIVRPDLSGLTVGATITGAPFDAVTQPTGGSITADNTHLGTIGTRSAKHDYVTGASTSGYTEIQLSCPSGAAAQFEINMDAAPAAIDRGFALVNSSNVAVVGFYVSTAGKLVAQNAAGGTVSGSPTYPSFPVGTRWLIDVIGIPGVSTSTGRIAFRVTNAATGTVLMSYDDSTNNVGTTQITKARYGRYIAVNQTWACWYANPGLSDDVSGFMAAPSSSSVNVAAVAATAVGQAIPPVVQTETIISGGGPATASAQAFAPTVATSTNVAAVAAVATAQAFAPAVSIGGSVNVSAVKASANAVAYAPGVTAGVAVTIVSVVATATAAARAPQVGTAAGRDITLTVGSPRRNPLAVGAPTGNPLTVGPPRR